MNMERSDTPLAYFSIVINYSQTFPCQIQFHKLQQGILPLKSSKGSLLQFIEIIKSMDKIFLSLWRKIQLCFKIDFQIHFSAT